MSSSHSLRPRAAVALSTAGILALVGAAPASASLLFDTSYASRGLDAWNGIHQPASTSRVSLVSGFAGLAGPVLKAEVRPGDKTYTGTYVAERSEVMGRVPNGGMNSGNPWPDPAGSTRWYRILLNVKPGFETPSDSRWVEVTQWKGRDGSVPPIGILAQKGRFVMKVKRSEALAVADLGPISAGDWVTFVVGIKWSAGSDGWVQVIRDGKTVVPKTSAPTMEYVNGVVDPIYLKQGVYRGSGWKSTHTAYFGDTLIGTARGDVDAAAPVTGSGSSSGGSSSGGSSGSPAPTPAPAPAPAPTPAPAAPPTAPAPAAVPTVTTSSSTEVQLVSSALVAPAPGDAVVSPASALAPAASRPTALANVRRRKSGRLRIRLSGLVRTGTGKGRCPDHVSVRISWSGSHKTYRRGVRVKGIKNCRVRSFVARPKVPSGRTVTMTVVGKGYRRVSADFNV